MVFDFETQIDEVIRGREDVGAQTDRAGVGKPDGIVKEVFDGLPDSGRHAMQDQWYVVGHFDRKAEAFGSCLITVVGDADIEQVAYIEFGCQIIGVAYEAFFDVFLHHRA